MKNRQLIEREKRFAVRDIENVRAVVLREGSGDLIDARLLDFSKSGLKLSVPFSPQFEEEIQIHILAQDCGARYEGQGSVRYIREIGSDERHVGVALESPLNEEIVRYFTSKSEQENRFSARVNVEAVGSLSLKGTAEENSATVVNISRGGFCLLSGAPHDVDSRIEFLIDDPSGNENVIEGRVAWKKASESGYVIGCEFADSNSYSRLLRCLVLRSEQKKVVKRSIGWPIMVASLLAMFLPSLAYMTVGKGPDEATASMVVQHIKGLQKQRLLAAKSKDLGTQKSEDVSVNDLEAKQTEPINTRIAAKNQPEKMAADITERPKTKVAEVRVAKRMDAVKPKLKKKRGKSSKRKNAKTVAKKPNGNAADYLNTDARKSVSEFKEFELNFAPEIGSPATLESSWLGTEQVALKSKTKQPATKHVAKKLAKKRAAKPAKKRRARRTAKLAKKKTAAKSELETVDVKKNRLTSRPDFEAAEVKKKVIASRPGFESRETEVSLDRPQFEIKGTVVQESLGEFESPVEKYKLPKVLVDYDAASIPRRLRVNGPDGTLRRWTNYLTNDQ